MNLLKKYIGRRRGHIFLTENGNLVSRDWINKKLGRLSSLLNLNILMTPEGIQSSLVSIFRYKGYSGHQIALLTRLAKHPMGHLIGDTVHIVLYLPNFCTSHNIPTPRPIQNLGWNLACSQSIKKKLFTTKSNQDVSQKIVANIAQNTLTARNNVDKRESKETKLEASTKEGKNRETKGCNLKSP